MVNKAKVEDLSLWVIICIAICFLITNIGSYYHGLDKGAHNFYVKQLDIQMAKRLDALMKPRDTTCVVEVRYRNKETHIWEGKRKIANTTY